MQYLRDRRVLAIVLLIVGGFFLLIIGAGIQNASFRVTGTTPGNGGEIPQDGGFEVRLNRTVTNSDEILRSFLFEPAARVDYVYGGDVLRFSPVSRMLPGEYTLTIPRIAAEADELTDVVLTFTVIEGSINDSDRFDESAEIARGDVGDVESTRFPFLSDLVRTDINYNIDYRYEFNTLTILVNLDPDVLPPLAQGDLVIAAYESARDEALIHLDSIDADLSEYEIRYTPTFMQDKYGTGVPAADFGDGLPPEEQEQLFDPTQVN